VNGPIHCLHANERPAVCPCSSDCYCKARGCLTQTQAAPTVAGQMAGPATFAELEAIVAPLREQARQFEEFQRTWEPFLKGWRARSTPRR
jgi:hypothetical protein